MSYENPDTAPSNDSRGGAGRVEDEEEAGHGSPDMSGGSTSPEGVNRGCGDSSSRGGSSSPGGASGGAGGSSGGDPRGPNSDDTDALSSGNDSGERESEGGMERENGSRGRQSTRSYQSSSSHNCKDSGMMLETTESNKR